MGRAWVLVVLLATAVAGCLQTPSPSPSGGEAAPSPPDPVPGVAFDPPVNVSRDHPGAEPVLARTSEGVLFVQGVGITEEGRPISKVWRSTDGGASWRDVTPAAPTGQELAADGHVAVGPDDTVYYVNGAGFVPALFVWQPAAEVWLVMPAPPWPVPMHRPWIVPGPDGVVDLFGESVARQEGFWHVRSTDRGRTWSAPHQVDADTFYGSVPARRPDGTLVAVRYTSGPWKVVASADGGETWETRGEVPREGRLTSGWPSLVADGDGTLYLVWGELRDDRGTVLLSASRDGGGTWTAPHRISRRNGTAAMAWADVRRPGQLGVVWYGADGRGPPKSTEAAWYVLHARVDDASTPDPRIRPSGVSPGPVRHGRVCSRGSPCLDGADAALREFLWIDHDDNGRAHVAYASTIDWDRPTAYPVYARQAPRESISRGNLTGWR